MKLCDLMFCYMSETCTVCDKGRSDNFVIAFIDRCGAIRFIDRKLPKEVIRRINNYADNRAAAFREKFMRKSKDNMRRELFDRMTDLQYYAYKHMDFSTKEQIYDMYIRVVCEQGHRVMPQRID